MPSLILFDTTTSAKPLTPSSPSPCLILFLAACDSAYMALNSPSRQVNAMVKPEMAKNFNYFMANFPNYFIANASCRGYLVDKMNGLLLVCKPLIRHFRNLIYNLGLKQKNAIVKPEIANFPITLIANASCRGYLVDEMYDLNVPSSNL